MAHFCRLPSLQAVQTFTIPLGETWELGLWGIDQNTGSLKAAASDAQVAVANPALFPASGGVLKFTLTANGMGGCDLNGVNDNGRSWAFAKVAVTSPVVPQTGGGEDQVLDAGPDYRVYPNYVDNNLKSGSYDMDASVMTLTYNDGTTFDLNYNTALANISSTKGESKGPGVVVGLSGFMLKAKSNRIVPLQYTEKTAPNITAMVLETDAVVQNNKALMKIAIKFLDIIATYATANAAMKGAKPGWKAVPRSGAAATTRAGAKMVSELPKGSKAVVNIGGTGEIPGAINMNPNTVASRSAIPNWLAKPAEELASEFDPNTIDQITSRNLPHNVFDWARIIPGAKAVLKPGGRFIFNFKYSAADAEKILQLLKDNNFTVVKNLGGYVIEAVKTI